MKLLLSPKYVGIILIIISVLMFFVILSFTQHIQNLNQYLHSDCTIPDEICPFKQDIPWESSIGFSVDVIIFVLGTLLFLTSRYPELPRRIIPRKSAKADLPAAHKSLDPTEKKLYEMISGSNAIFQSELVEKSGMSKVKVTRILDKLEAKGLVERKRRGMTNVVVPKK